MKLPSRKICKEKQKFKNKGSKYRKRSPKNPSNYEYKFQPKLIQMEEYSINYIRGTE